MYIEKEKKKKNIQQKKKLYIFPFTNKLDNLINLLGILQRFLVEVQLLHYFKKKNKNKKKTLLLPLPFSLSFTPNDGTKYNKIFLPTQIQESRKTLCEHLLNDPLLFYIPFPSHNLKTRTNERKKIISNLNIIIIKEEHSSRTWSHHSHNTPYPSLFQRIRFPLFLFFSSLFVLFLSLSFFRTNFYRCYVARTAEMAAGELSPIVGVPAPQGCCRCAAGGGVSARCCPCSGHFSNTYQQRLRWYKDRPRRNCTMSPDRWRPPRQRSDTRRTATPQPWPRRGSTAWPEEVPNHLARQPPGMVTGTRNLVALWNQNRDTG